MTAPTNVLSTTPSRGLVLATWLPRIVLAVVFLGAGMAKVSGDPAMIAMFDQIGAGQGLRYLVGGLELAGAIGVLIPRLCGLAAIGLVLLMVGATVTNLAVLDATVLPSVALALLAGAAVYLRRHHLDPRRR